MDFRSRLLETLRRIAPLFAEPGVMVVGSEVPNLLQPGAASTLVVSLEPRAAMPDPRLHRHLAASFLERLEREEEARS